MAVTALPADPHGRVTSLLRARQVSCRGGLTDLADAVLTITQPPPARLADGFAQVDQAETRWRRERSALLLDRDTLVCALDDLHAAAARHLHAGTAATAAELTQALTDALDALEPLPAVPPCTG